MSSIDRLKEYAAMKGPAGEAVSKANLRYWAERATENSDSHKHRAKGGEIKLPDAGGKLAVHDSDAPPRRNAKADARMVAKDDLNVVGAKNFMPRVRRTTT